MLDLFTPGAARHLEGMRASGPGPEPTLTASYSGCRRSDDRCDSEPHGVVTLLERREAGVGLHEQAVEAGVVDSVRERTFMQSTPMGDLVIVTLEGDDPGRAFGKMMGADDAFSRWFAERAKELHGLDVTVRPTGAPSELIIDTEPEASTVG